MATMAEGQFAPAENMVPPGAEAYNARAEEVGMVLDEQALRALVAMPQEHAEELLEGTIERRTTLRNPSSYITSIVSRGFVPRAGKGAGGKGSTWSETLDVAELQYRGVRGLPRMLGMGIELTDEALRALGSLNPEHASEIVEFIVESPPGSLRDPSNYIASTVARGFVSRKGLGSAPPGGGTWDGHNDPGYGAVAVGGGYNLGAPTVVVPAAQAPAASAPIALPQNMIPHDVSRLEMHILKLNAMNLWEGGQQIDFPSYLALRCVPEHQAVDILDAMERKSKFSGISSPCNYVQATVAKIQKGSGKGKDGKGDGYNGYGGGGYAAVPGGGAVVGKCGGKDNSHNPTGNLSGQRAHELGLDLEPEASKVLANMPLREAFAILEEAAQVAATGGDPSEYVLNATGRGGGGELDAKRPRTS